MTQVASDSFDYADATDITTVAPNWSAVENLSTSRVGVLSGQVYPFGNIRSCDRWNADEFSDDQYAEATIVNLGSQESVGVAVRCAAGSASYYFVVTDSTYVLLKKVISGVASTLLYDIPGLPATPFVLRLEVFASTLLISIDGGAFASISDSSLTSGYPGIVTDGNSADPPTLLDDWSAGDVVTVEAPPSSTYTSLRSRAVSGY